MESVVKTCVVFSPAGVSRFFIGVSPSLEHQSLIDTEETFEKIYPESCHSRWRDPPADGGDFPITDQSFILLEDVAQQMESTQGFFAAVSKKLDSLNKWTLSPTALVQWTYLPYIAEVPEKLTNGALERFESVTIERSVDRLRVDEEIVRKCGCGPCATSGGSCTVRMRINGDVVIHVVVLVPEVLDISVSVREKFARPNPVIGAPIEVVASGEPLLDQKLKSDGYGATSASVEDLSLELGEMAAEGLWYQLTVLSGSKPVSGTQDARQEPFPFMSEGSGIITFDPRSLFPSASLDEFPLTSAFSPKIEYTEGVGMFRAGIRARMLQMGIEGIAGSGLDLGDVAGPRYTLEFLRLLNQARSREQKVEKPDPKMATKIKERVLEDLPETRIEGPGSPTLDYAIERSKDEGYRRSSSIYSFGGPLGECTFHKNIIVVPPKPDKVVLKVKLEDDSGNKVGLSCMIKCLVPMIEKIRGLEFGNAELYERTAFRSKVCQAVVVGGLPWAPNHAAGVREGMMKDLTMVIEKEMEMADIGRTPDLRIFSGVDFCGDTVWIFTFSVVFVPLLPNCATFVRVVRPWSFVEIDLNSVQIEGSFISQVVCTQDALLDQAARRLAAYGCPAKLDECPKAPNRVQEYRQGSLQFFLNTNRGTSTIKEPLDDLKSFTSSVQEKTFNLVPHVRKRNTPSAIDDFLAEAADFIDGYWGERFRVEKALWEDTVSDLFLHSSLIRKGRLRLPLNTQKVDETVGILLGNLESGKMAGASAALVTNRDSGGPFVDGSVYLFAEEIEKSVLGFRNQIISYFSRQTEDGDSLLNFHVFAHVQKYSITPNKPYPTENDLIKADLGTLDTIYTVPVELAQNQAWEKVYLWKIHTTIINKIVEKGTQSIADKSFEHNSKAFPLTSIKDLLQQALIDADAVLDANASYLNKFLSRMGEAESVIGNSFEHAGNVIQFGIFASEKTDRVDAIQNDLALNSMIQSSLGYLDEATLKNGSTQRVDEMQGASRIFDFECNKMPLPFNAIASFEHAEEARLQLDQILSRTDRDYAKIAKTFGSRLNFYPVTDCGIIVLRSGLYFRRVSAGRSLLQNIIHFGVVHWGGLAGEDETAHSASILDEGMKKALDPKSFPNMPDSLTPLALYMSDLAAVSECFRVFAVAFPYSTCRCSIYFPSLDLVAPIFFSERTKSKVHIVFSFTEKDGWFALVDPQAEITFSGSQFTSAIKIKHADYGPLLEVSCNCIGESFALETSGAKGTFNGPVVTSANGLYMTTFYPHPSVVLEKRGDPTRMWFGECKVIVNTEGSPIRGPFKVQGKIREELSKLGKTDYSDLNPRNGKFEHIERPEPNLASLGYTEFQTDEFKGNDKWTEYFADRDWANFQNEKVPFTFAFETIKALIDHKSDSVTTGFLAAFFSRLNQKKISYRLLTLEEKVSIFLFNFCMSVLQKLGNLDPLLSVKSSDFDSLATFLTVSNQKYFEDPKAYQFSLAQTEFDGFTMLSGRMIEQKTFESLLQSTHEHQQNMAAFEFISLLSGKAEGATAGYKKLAHASNLIAGTKQPNSKQLVKILEQRLVKLFFRDNVFMQAHGQQEIITLMKNFKKSLEPTKNSDDDELKYAVLFSRTSKDQRSDDNDDYLACVDGSILFYYLYDTANGDAKRWEKIATLRLKALNKAKYGTSSEYRGLKKLSTDTKFLEFVFVTDERTRISGKFDLISSEKPPVDLTERQSQLLVMLLLIQACSSYLSGKDLPSVPFFLELCSKFDHPKEDAPLRDLIMHSLPSDLADLASECWGSTLDAPGWGISASAETQRVFGMTVQRCTVSSSDFEVKVTFLLPTEFPHVSLAARIERSLESCEGSRSVFIPILDGEQSLLESVRKTSNSIMSKTGDCMWIPSGIFVGSSVQKTAPIAPIIQTQLPDFCPVSFLKMDRFKF